MTDDAKKLRVMQRQRDEARGEVERMLRLRGRHVQPRELVGRKIVAIGRERFRPRQHSTERRTALHWLKLDNGKVLVLHACESDWEPYVEANLVEGGSR